DPLRLEQLRKRRAVSGRLANGLVEQDHAADELFGALRREEHVAVRATVLLRRIDADRVEPLLDRRVGLVGCEDSLAFGDERLRGGMQIVVGHLFLRGLLGREVSLRSGGMEGPRCGDGPSSYVSVRSRGVRLAALAGLRGNPKGVTA